MKILLYSEGLELIKNSGLGKAINHQIESLKNSDIEYTLDSNCSDYDIVHINFYTPKSYFFAKKAHKLGKKVVYHAHSTEEDFRNSFPFSNLLAPLFKKWITLCYKQGDYIITPTDYSKKLLEKYNLNRPIYSLSNGIDMNFFEKNNDLGIKFRKEFGFSENDKIVMGVGLYFKRKGILEFIELARRLPEYQFIWFGSNPLYMSPRKIRKALKTNLPNLHLPGYVEPEIIRGAYSGSDIFIFPTKEETEGIPILEAFTSKINTIVSDIPVFEWAEKDRVVYKAKTIDEFEKYIKEILQNKKPSLVNEAYKKVNEKEIRKIGKQLIQIYRTVYAEENRKLIIKQTNLNEKLAQFFKDNKIKKFRMISLGNSISSGYSMVRTTKPLLLRNESIFDIMNKNDIRVSMHHFARAQNNSDEHIFDWIENNLKESEIHKLNRSDYSKEITSMPVHGLSNKKIDEYYPLKEDDVGIKDLLTDSDDTLANIVIYNGGTGSFLDGLTRKGTIFQQLMHGVKRDISSIEAILKVIQNSNRNKNSNTQVYLCGAPDFLGLKVSELINFKLKRIAEQYANVVYVEPVKSKFIYKKLDDNDNPIQGKSPDVHYDEDEYIEFNNNIINTVNNNFQNTQLLINIDRKFYKLSKEIELEKKELVTDYETREKIIAAIIEEEIQKINDQSQKYQFLKRLKKYMMGRFPYDFFYLGKNEINNSIIENIKIIK